MSCAGDCWSTWRWWTYMALTVQVTADLPVDEGASMASFGLALNFNMRLICAVMLVFVLDQLFVY